MYEQLFKRFFDLILSLVALIALLPVFLLSIFSIKITSKGPILFKQERLGKDGEEFQLLKFRTMTHKTRKKEKQVFSDNPEITKVGKILRRFKIDELPQLINILKGDMAIIGPRPCLPNLKEGFDRNGLKRLDVKPGLSGLAQVNGNIHLDWPERWRYDAEYVENLSFWLDLKIIFKTFLIIILGEEKFVSKKDA